MANDQLRGIAAHTDAMTTNDRITSLEDLQTTGRATITHTEAATLLGIDPRTLLAEIDRGKLPATRIGNKTLIPVPTFREAFHLTSPAA